MRYIIGQCPHCERNIVAAMHTGNRRQWNLLIEELEDRDLIVKILEDPIAPVTAQNHEIGCPRKKSLEKAARYATVE